MVTTRRVQYMSDPVMQERTPIVLRCTVVAMGTGQNARRGSVMVQADEEFEVISFAAKAPRLLLISPPVSSLRETIGILVVQAGGPDSGGLYDEIEYEWELSPISPGTIQADANRVNRAEWRAPTPMMSRVVTACLAIRCTANVRGTGTNARDGTEDSSFVEDALSVPVRL